MQTLFDGIFEDVPGDSTQAEHLSMKSLATVDLFSGCGGLSLGLSKAGFSITHAFDSWAPAVQVYKANFNHGCCAVDLSDVDAAVSAIMQHDFQVIVGGPPCQDFSQAGTRIEGSRANLTNCFADIVVRCMPPLFIMENVERAQKSKSFSNAKVILEEAGYFLTEQVLNASFYGVPQSRKRLFCIGTKSLVVTSEISRRLHSNASSSPMTVRDYMGGELDTEFYYRHPRNYSRRAVFSIDEPAPTMRGVNRPIPSGYPGHPGDAASVKEKDLVRPLTARERARIQTFPKSFKFSGTKTHDEQLIGNAVPVELACAVGNSISEALHEFSVLPHGENAHINTKIFSKFANWLQVERSYAPKSSADIVSRVRRVQRHVGMTRCITEPHVWAFATNYTALSGCSSSVRSQLKRAIILFQEFMKS